MRTLEDERMLTPTWNSQTHENLLELILFNVTAVRDMYHKQLQLNVVMSAVRSNFVPLHMPISDNLGEFETRLDASCIRRLAVHLGDDSVLMRSRPDTDVVDDSRAPC